MNATDGPNLRQILENNYINLRDRLGRRVGSTDLAAEILHDVWLRLEKTPSAVVNSPLAYLYRMALNIAADRSRSEKRWYSKLEIEALLSLHGLQPTPEDIAGAKSDLSAVLGAIGSLPPQRRDIARAALVEGLPHNAIAKRFGLSLRTMERELQRALLQCRQSIENNSRGTRQEPAVQNVSYYEAHKSGHKKDRKRDN